MGAFRLVDLSAAVAPQEEKILAFWKAESIFEKQVEQKSDDPENQYIFYDGPPFATGLPHYGHLVASTLKDIVPRYWAMRGKRVERRFGWDTHGLPIEMEIEKKLNLSGPTSIREFGVEKFNETCRENVLRFTQEWQKTIERLGRWVDFENDYKTMDLPFMESVWWVFHQLWEKGLVYQGVRVMPFSWRLSTPLSNFEANLDYRDVDDPAITVKLAIDDDPDQAKLLIWTTTPWTLPSNLGVAVGEDLEYVRASRADDDTVYILAKDRLEAVLGKDATVHATILGKELVGKTYKPLFEYFSERKADGAFCVIASDHVTTGDGTGLVHMAPAFGEDDFLACKNAGISPVDPVNEEGCFTSAVGDFEGQFVKDADKGIIRRLKEEGHILHHATIRHPYPYCWRSETPLIYKTVPVWFVKVEEQRDRMVKHNKEIHWVPEAVGQKRFHNWLQEARDWAISRNRFWGTPIPVWECKSCETRECLSSVSELHHRTGEEITDIHPHRIDHLTIDCPSCNEPMSRISEVFDCWFESGAMPYAQIHYPFEHKEAFEAGFPAQFIAEGLDQTRGWFYTLLALSTALFDKAPFKNVIVNGLILAEDGSKMSKSKKNYPDPMKVLDQYGADALRAYLINSPVVRGEPLRFSEDGVREVTRSVLIPLRNAWSFFTQYANIDEWSPTKRLAHAPTASERPELDRWILSMLQSLVADVNQQMEGYYLYKVIPPLVGFIDHLTNWYIRRSRRRFWRSASDADAQRDKDCAYATLYEVLVTFSKLMAPVLPFVTESMYQHLVVDTGMANAQEGSVHLCPYPQEQTDRIDGALEAAMAHTRVVVFLGRALREKHRLKTRQPLKRAIIVSHDPAAREHIEAHRELICEELNVKTIDVQADDATLADLQFKPNYKTLGRKMGKRMKEAASEIASLSREAWVNLQNGGTIEICDQEIHLEDIQVDRSPKGDVVLETQDGITVALDTALDDALKAEGFIRELISHLQKERKEAGLSVTDRIQVSLSCDDEFILSALETHRAHLSEEVLASSLHIGAFEKAQKTLAIDGSEIRLSLQKAS